MAGGKHAAKEYHLWAQRTLSAALTHAWLCALSVVPSAANGRRGLRATCIALSAAGARIAATMASKGNNSYEMSKYVPIAPPHGSFAQPLTQSHLFS